MAASLADLQNRLHLPSRIPLTAGTWAAAAVLGQLRTSINNEHRHPTRDRGSDTNARNDLQGALGELLGLEILRRAGLSLPTQGLLDLNGSVDRPDLIADIDPQVRLDVKCHFDEPRKKLFLVNEVARTRSIDRGVAAFLPIVTAELHEYAHAGALVPIEQLTNWEVGPLGPHNDPCRQLLLTELDEQFLGNSGVVWQSEPPDERWGHCVLSSDTVERMRRFIDSRSLLENLRSNGYTLDGLTSLEARRRLLDLLPRDLLGSAADN